MGTENWFARLKKRRTEKKIAKLRQQFGFLIEEYRFSQDNSVNEIKMYQERLISSCVQAVEQNAIDSVGAIEKKLNKQMNEVQEIIHEYKTCYMDDKHKFEELLNVIIRKISLLDNTNVDNHKKIEKLITEMISSTENSLVSTSEKIGISISDRAAVVQNSINEICGEMKQSNREVIKLLQGIDSQLELVQKNARGIVDTTEVMLDEKTRIITLCFDEIKTLMKIVAVNNLLDEIKE